MHQRKISNKSKGKNRLIISTRETAREVIFEKYNIKHWAEQRLVYLIMSCKIFQSSFEKTFFTLAYYDCDYSKHFEGIDISNLVYDEHFLFGINIKDKKFMIIKELFYVIATSFSGGGDDVRRTERFIDSTIKKRIRFEYKGDGGKLEELNINLETI